LKRFYKFNGCFTNHGFWFVVALLLFSTYGCKSTKLVPPNQHLLVKNKVKVNEGSNNIFNQLISVISSEQALYIKHKPNRKILVLGRFYLKMYNFGSSKKNPSKNERKKWRKYLRKIGEAPVLLDSVEIEKSCNNIKKYLNNKGYYNCVVNYEVKFKKKKATVIYIITPNAPFEINNVFINADDVEIDNFLNNSKAISFLKNGNNLDIDVINKERNRITTLLRNNGYIEFGKEFIDFELDTINKNNKVDVFISVVNKLNGDRFIRKTIDSIVVNFENDFDSQSIERSVEFQDIVFNFNGYPLKPLVLTKNILLKKGAVFSQKSVDDTYAKLSELPIFKFIDIKFVPSSKDSVGGLMAVINLRTTKRQSFSIEPQGIVSQLNRLQTSQVGDNSNSYGIANTLIWTNRNLFKNAELLEVSSNTRFETQFYRPPAANQLFYTNLAVQQGINLGLTIPKSFFLRPIEKNIYVRAIKTNLRLSYLYEYNPDYVRKILPFTYQYQIEAKNSTIFLNVAEISFSRNAINTNLSGSDSTFIRRIFQNNLITSTGLSFIYSNRSTTKSRSFFFVRANLIEFGGNIHRFIRRAIDTKKSSDTSYQLFKVNYYQYAKSEIDARCSTILNEKSSVAFRFNLGVTYPYGNEKEVAFDKLFFIGGANSLRGWRPRTIGPGSYKPLSNNFRIDRAGDIILQLNTEYRFDIISKKLEGAFFIDAGNVWIMRNINNIDPYKLFKVNDFYQSIAANGGIGLRVDFQFFLFRLDYGFQIHNPENDGINKWVIRNFGINQYFTKSGIINFGIGYPF